MCAGVRVCVHARAGCVHVGARCIHTGARCVRVCVHELVLRCVHVCWGWDYACILRLGVCMHAHACRHTLGLGGRQCVHAGIRAGAGALCVASRKPSEQDRYRTDLLALSQAPTHQSSSSMSELPALQRSNYSQHVLTLTPT